MLFNSLEFLIFFPVVTILYFVIPHRFRWGLLLIASCIFYMALIPVYILIRVILILIDYVAGILIEQSEGRKRKFFLILSIVSNVGFLGFFKYYNFFLDNFTAMAHFFHFKSSLPFLSILLPVGLSFHTFQAMSYTIEVYRGKQKAERHLGIYALYVMFYPQLVAGPIERPQNLIHQFYEEHFFDYQRVTDGLKLMAWGMFKKVVIADRLAVCVGQVYGNPTVYQGWDLLLATAFFAIQIYCDFSGYSEVALGSAQVMGFKLMTNFNSPYFAKSISEFWKRWHISLTTWFKDYMYIPMGGNRVGRPRWFFNLFFIFLVSGLWHGASWTYVAWGAINGFYLLCSIWTQKFRKRFVQLLGIREASGLHKTFQILITFALICFSWIFFRAKSFSDAFYIMTHSFSGLTARSGFLSSSRGKDLGVAFIVILILAFVDHLRRHGTFSFRYAIAGKPTWFRWVAYYALVFSILLFGKFGTDAQQFIYFQF